MYYLVQSVNVPNKAPFARHRSPASAEAVLLDEMVSLQGFYKKVP